MNNPTIILTLILLTLAPITQAADLDDALAAFPTDDASQQCALAQRILDLGHDALLETCRRLEPAGGQDAPARYALEALTACVLLPGREDDQRLFEEAILDALQAESRTQVQLFLIERLARAGSERSFHHLAQCLLDEDLTAGALWALEAIDAPATADLLRESLPSVPASHRANLRAVIDTLTAPAPDLDRARQLLRDPGAPQHLRCRALTILVEADQLKTPDLIQYALAADELAAAALDLAARFPSTADTRLWADALPDADPAAQLAILRMLTDRNDPAAFPAAASENLLAAPDAPIRHAAADACARLAPEQAIPILLDRLQAADPADHAPLQGALLRLPTDPLVQAASDGLPDAAPPAQAALLELLAQRQLAPDTALIFHLAAQGHESVQPQALRTLGATIPADESQQLAALTAAAPDSRTRAAGQQALVAALNRLPDRNQAARGILEAFKAADPAGQIALLPVLARVADEPSLQLVSQLATDANADLADAALRTLAAWPDPAAAGRQLQLAAADSTPENLRTLLLRGAVQTLRQSDLPPGHKLEIYQLALETAARPAEKQLVLAALADLHTPYAILLASRSLEDPATRSAAADAIAAIAASENLDLDQACPAALRDALTQAKPHLDAEKAPAIDNALKNLPDPANTPTPHERAAGFEPLFNGRDLTGWSRHENLPGHGLAGKWTVEDAAITGRQDPPGQGGFLVTDRSFRDFELRLETRVDWPFDSGVFLRVGPTGKSHQVTLDYRPTGQVGSIYCPWTQGRVHDCPDGVDFFKPDDWNDLRISCSGEPARIVVWLNGVVITDFQHTAETTAGVPTEGTIALQVHPGGEGFDQAAARFRRIRIRPLDEGESAPTPLFNGRDLAGWTGALDGCSIENGALISRTGKIFTEKTYGDFQLDFAFKLPPGGNNGIGIRAPLEGDPAYTGMEIQVLDNTAPQFANLKPYQYHGSIYGVAPAQRGCLNPPGQWNEQTITANGNEITVTLNGHQITQADLTIFLPNTTPSVNAAHPRRTPDQKIHPGLHNRAGHLGILGHNSPVEFRHLTIQQNP